MMSEACYRRDALAALSSLLFDPLLRLPGRRSSMSSMKSSDAVGRDVVVVAGRRRSSSMSSSSSAAAGRVGEEIKRKCHGACCMHSTRT